MIRIEGYSTKEMIDYERIKEIVRGIPLEGESERELRYNRAIYTIIFINIKGTDCAVPAGADFEGYGSWSKGKRQWRIHIYKGTELKRKAGILHELVECELITSILKKLLGKDFEKSRKRAERYDESRKLAHQTAKKLEERFWEEEDKK